jgi:hypothetical protein
MEELHVRGCYGKASLSRGSPAIITVREKHHHADDIATAATRIEHGSIHLLL